MESIFPAGSSSTVTLADAMAGADFVLIDDQIFEADYLRAPDEYTVDDDVVIEGSRGDDEIALTRADVDGALHMGAGVFRLKSGIRLRFVTSATIH